MKFSIDLKVVSADVRSAYATSDLLTNHAFST